MSQKKYEDFFDKDTPSFTNVSKALASNHQSIIINLRGRYYRELPKEILALKQVVSLSLDISGIEGLKDEETFDFLSKLDTLKKLDLSSITLGAFPENIKGLEKLETLALYNTHATYFPENFSKLNLKKLNLRLCSIQNIEVITAIESLEVLILKAVKTNDNLLQKLTNLSNLKRLNINKSNISFLPENFGNLKTLTSLDLGENKLKKLPTSFAQLKNLKELNLEKNKSLDWNQALTVLEKLTNIQKFYFNHNSDNSYKSIFLAISKMPLVKDIYLAENKLDLLPKTFYALKQIEKLTFVNCDNLLTIEEDIRYFDVLKEIHIVNTFENNLEEVFEIIAKIKSLETLKISFSRLVKLPKNLSSLNNIKTLILENNTVLDLKDAFLKITKIPQLQKLISTQEYLQIPDEVEALGHIKHIVFNYPKNNSNKFIDLPLNVALFKNVKFESNQSKTFDAINKYFDYFENTAIPDEKKKLLFAIITHNTKRLTNIKTNILLNDSFNPQKAIFYKSGKINGFSQTQLKDKFKENGINLVTKLSNKVTHVLVGINNKNEVLEKIISYDNVELVFENHIKEYFWKQDTPYLMEQGAEEMNEKILNLLFSEDDENILLAFQMLEGGGAHSSIVTYLAVIQLFHPDKNIRKNARPIFKTYASTELQEYIKKNWKISFRNNGLNFELFKTLYSHPELDVGNFMIMLGHLIANNSRYRNCLNWSNNNLQKLPKALIYMSGLEEINFENINHLDFEQAFDHIKTLPKIKVIKIENCELKEIPRALCELKSLEKLYIIRTKIEKIPDNIGKLTNLKTLYIEYCPLKELNKNIAKLTKLEDLNICSCKLENIDNLCALENLSRLILSYNNIKTINNTISSFKNLKVLYIRDNQIESIDESFGNLPQLEVLDMSHNKIKELPKKLNWPKLQRLNIDIDKIENMPEHLIKIAT